MFGEVRTHRMGGGVEVRDGGGVEDRDGEGWRTGQEPGSGGGEGYLVLFPGPHYLSVHLRGGTVLLSLGEGKYRRGGDWRDERTGNDWNEEGTGSGCVCVCVWVCVCVC